MAIDKFEVGRTYAWGSDHSEYDYFVVADVSEDTLYYRYPNWEKGSEYVHGVSLRSLNLSGVVLITEENEEEVRSVSSTGAEKGVKLAQFSLLPMEALTEVAKHYGRGAKKYEKHNMRGGYEWSKSYDALMRHATQFWAGEDIDEETGSHHLTAVVFHALTLLEFKESHPEFDDRYIVKKQ